MCIVVEVVAQSAETQTMSPRMQRRRILRLALGLAVGSMLGCATDRYRPEKGHRVSTLDISSVLISADGKQLVVLTDTRHFVFSAPAKLVAALRSKFHPRLTGDFGVVVIEPNAEVSVSVKLEMPAGSIDEWREARGMGFDTKYGQPSTWELVPEPLRGVVYKANAVTPPADAMKLNRTYQVMVAEKGAGLGYSDVPSPIRAMGEGALGIALAPLALLAIPLILVVMPKGVGVGP